MFRRLICGAIQAATQTLNQEQVNQMSTLVTLGNTTTAMLKLIKQILVFAKNSYHSLNTSNSWNVPSGHHAAREFKHPPK